MKSPRQRKVAMRDGMVDLLAEVQRVGSQRDLLQANVTRLPAGDDRQTAKDSSFGRGKPGPDQTAGTLPSGGLCRSLSQILREARKNARAEEQRRCCDVLLAAEGVSPRAPRSTASVTPRRSDGRKDVVRIVHRHHHQHQHHHYVVANDIPPEQLEKWEEAMNRSSPRRQGTEHSAQLESSSGCSGQSPGELMEEVDQHIHYHHHTGEREVPMKHFAMRLAEAAAAGLAAHNGELRKQRTCSHTNSSWSESGSSGTRLPPIA